MASSSSRSGSWFNSEPQHLCNCVPAQQAIWKSSNSDTNPERRYFFCRRRGKVGDCGFWLWIDPDLTPHYKEAFQKLKLEKDLAVAELLRERKNKKSNEEEEELGDPKEDSNKDMKQMARNIESLECKMKGLYLVFLVVGLLVLYLKA